MKKHLFCRRMWLAAAILWLVVIWSNSMHTATESSAQSSRVMELLTPLLAVTPVPEELWHTLVRKLAHMAEFALLGMLWSAVLLPAPNLKTPHCTIWSRRGWALFVCLLGALVDETIQLFVPGRSGELRDVWIDLFGSLAGVAVALGVTHFWEKHFRWEDQHNVC